MFAKERILLSLKDMHSFEVRNNDLATETDDIETPVTMLAAGLATGRFHFLIKSVN